MQQASTLPGHLLTLTETLHLKKIIYSLFLRPPFSKITNKLGYLTGKRNDFQKMLRIYYLKVDALDTAILKIQILVILICRFKSLCKNNYKSCAPFPGLKLPKQCFISSWNQNKHNNLHTKPLWITWLGSSVLDFYKASIPWEAQRIIWNENIYFHLH